MAIDPVCGMTVDEETTQHKTEYAGQTYYFCSLVCKRTFDREHAKFPGTRASGHRGGHGSVDLT